MVVPYCKAFRPATGWPRISAATRAVASCGKLRWSTNPAASEISPGLASAVCMNSLMTGGSVRLEAALNGIMGVMGSLPGRKEKPGRIAAYNNGSTDPVKADEVRRPRAHHYKGRERSSS